MELVVNKDRIKQIALKVLDKQISESRPKKTNGLLLEDRLMFDRIFSQPEPQATYQDHFALTPEWKARHKIKK